MGANNSKSILESNVNPLARRDFMKMVGGGIVVFFAVDPAVPAAQFPKFGGGQTDFNDYLKIAEDGHVTVYSGKIEMGQGNTTALAQMAADELGVALDTVTMVMGDTELCPWDMGTFGSMSIRVYGQELRAAAAEAREILLVLAAESLKKPKTQLKISNGVIYDKNDESARVSFGHLAKGQKILRKLEGKAATKPVSEFTYIGKSINRLDGMAKVTGKAKYTGDLRFPDLMYARVLRPPAHGATLKSVDTSAAEKIPGVTVVNEDGIVAVLHADPETASKALAGIQSEYDVEESTLDENTIFDHLVKTAPQPRSIDPKGDLAEGEKISNTLFEETYLNGYGAHAPIETHTACAKMEGEKMTVWASTQTPFMNQSGIARALGIPSDNVRVLTPLVGGGFGGKSAGTQDVEAARLAKITGKTVQVSYDREEEFFMTAYRPAAVVKIKSGIDSDGKITLWDYNVYCAGDRGSEQYYDVPHNLIRTYGSAMGGMMGGPSQHPILTGTWRAPGANINIFAKESQIDIMAAKCSMDPLEFRLKNTSDPRMRRVLEAAAERFGYTPAAAPSGRGIGFGCGIDAGSYVAQIAEIELKNGSIRVKKIVAAQDMGICINPKGALMQMEGCIMMGLGYTLTEDISFKGGKIFTSNFHNYKIPRFSMLPEIDAFIVKNDKLDPQGGGEPSVVPVGAAVANALFDLNGVRVFQMPLTPERIKAART
ncbi:MAG: xanthine dehydrogenase family protein molybdopterin-binding subunit [Acidobacteria bacterium]|nr:xanthine dehydrogenase family protein molybdopterin-binding subunit [Acidobacteriota bacterium]